MIIGPGMTGIEQCKDNSFLFPLVVFVNPSLVCVWQKKPYGLGMLWITTCQASHAIRGSLICAEASGQPQFECHLFRAVTLELSKTFEVNRPCQEPFMSNLANSLTAVLHYCNGLLLAKPFSVNGVVNRHVTQLPLTVHALCCLPNIPQLGSQLARFSYTVLQRAPASLLARCFVAKVQETCKVNVVIESTGEHAWFTAPMFDARTHEPLVMLHCLFFSRPLTSGSNSPLPGVVPFKSSRNVSQRNPTHYNCIPNPRPTWWRMSQYRCRRCKTCREAPWRASVRLNVCARRCWSTGYTAKAPWRSLTPAGQNRLFFILQKSLKPNWIVTFIIKI